MTGRPPRHRPASAITRLTAESPARRAGHEIAHWYLGHTGEGNAATRREAELAADRLGARLACQAGYDVTKGAAVYRFMSKSRVHPERAVRRAAVLAVGCGRWHDNLAVTILQL